ncbi:MAG: hypothetical protein ACO2PN_22040 [Pyrobaculum sp.]
MLRGWGEGLLRRDNVDKRKRKKGLFACRYIPTGIRSQVYSCEEKPAGKYLQLLAPQTFSHSGTTSAVSSTWYILAGIPVALYLSVFTCGE